ncbi:hypothetical protein Glove_366g44 [Diversispora epigaea]|uniref:Uncharacterized protein n=1 Tax=Diversispora epigaea TaxID=1348612 RepID=A0A397H7K5_9GLOM|nr:hypothetical protein Glove_366g44 [Diversispora epigaea]
MTQIIKNVWPKKKNIPNLQIAWVISIAEIILNPNNENIKISEEIIKPVLLKNLNKIENNESFEYESDSPERLEVAPKRLAAPKKSAVPERPAAPRILLSQQLTKKLRALRSTLCARVKTSIFEVCKVPPISIAAEAPKISAWKKNSVISNSFRKLFDKVDEDEEDTYMTQIIKNVWPKKKNIPNLQIAWVISIAEIILNPNNENIKISEEIIKPVLLKNLNKIENNESFEYESDSPERLEVAPKRLAAPKKSAVPERPAAPRSNKRITEIKTSRKEKKKIRSIRKDEKNDDDDDEADEVDKAYEANETYETDEGDKYYNEIINIDETKCYENFCGNFCENIAKYCGNFCEYCENIAKYCEILRNFLVQTSEMKICANFRLLKFPDAVAVVGVVL